MWTNYFVNILGKFKTLKKNENDIVLSERFMYFNKMYIYKYLNILASDRIQSEHER